MKLIQVGQVGKPHGFRGEFLLSKRAASGDLPEEIDTVYIGPSVDQASPFLIQDTTAMPKGLRLKLQGFESDTRVKELSGQSVFIPRDSLPETDTDEFYVQDLVGCEVRDLASDESLGRISGVEEVGRGCADRWWIQSESQSFAIPATATVIARVDMSNRLIWIKDGNDFQSNT